MRRKRADTEHRSQLLDSQPAPKHSWRTKPWVRNPCRRSVANPSLILKHQPSRKPRSKCACGSRKVLRLKVRHAHIRALPIRQANSIAGLISGGYKITTALRKVAIKELR